MGGARLKMDSKIVLFVLMATIVAALAQTESQFVCYNDDNCADSESRPIFTLGGSVQSCCEMPDIVSALDHSQNVCTDCGPPTLERISPEYIILSTPETLVIEIQATRFSGITWVHNGTAMHDFPRLELDNFSKTLIVTNTTVNDSGIYEVDAHTIGGGILTTNFVVASYGSPSVVLSRSELLPDSEFLILTCTAVGYPPPSVAFNNWDLDRSAHIVNGTTVRQVYVFIANITGEEIYTCTASNVLPNGTEVTVEESITLNRAEFIPGIAPVNGELNITLPDRIEISCTVSGLPVPSIEWFKDGLPFAEAEEEGRIIIESNDSTVSTLIVERSTFDDRGRYSCTSSNRFGSSSADFVVSVLVPPNVTAWPEEVVVNVFDAGRTVMFVCEVFGFPLPKVTWNTIEGGLLNDYCNGSSTGEDLGGEADYDNYGGEDYVGGTPTTIPPTNEIIGEALLTQTTSGSTQPSSLPVTDPIIVDDLRPSDCLVTVVAVRDDAIQSVLTVNGANMEHSTTFICNGENGISNFINSPEMDSVTLTIEASPFFQTRPRVEIGTILSLYVEIICVIVDRVQPNITWYRELGPTNREPVVAERRTSISLMTQVEDLVTSTSVLAISNAQVGDSAIYTCQAENQNGIGVASSTLVVTVPANITVPPQNIEVRNNETATFICQAYGIPLPAIQWAMVDNGTLIYLDSFTGSESVTTDITTGTVTSLLQIGNIQPTDEGEYICLTSNGVALNNLTTITENATAVLSITQAVTIGFARDIYEVSENGVTVSLTVSVLSGVLQQEVTVVYSLHDGTAQNVESGMFIRGDYLDDEKDLVFSPQVTTSEQIVAIRNDLVVEDPFEYFLANLSFQSGPVEGITLSPAEVQVFIFDDDVVVIGFEQMLYNVSEDAGILNIRLRLLEGALNREVDIISINFTGNTAMNIVDFLPEDSTTEIVFGPDISEVQVSIQIIDDVINEGTENFLISLATNDSAVELNPASAIINIIDNDEAPDIAVTPQTISTTPGDVVSFTCSATGTQLPIVTWYYEGMPLISVCTDTNFCYGEQNDDANDSLPICEFSCNDDIATNNTVTLTIFEATMKDAGTYVCEADNGLGNVLSTNATLFIQLQQEPPFILEPNETTSFNVTAPSGFVLACTARGRPLPEIMWLKDDLPLSVISQKYIIENMNVDEFSVHSTLTVQNTELIDQGKYTCLATNNVGNDSSVFQLSILTTTVINVTPQSASVTFPGGSAVFTCTGFGSPLPEITWFYEGFPIEICSSCADENVDDISEVISSRQDDTFCVLICERLGPYNLSVTLSLTDVTPNDIGNYSCIGNNQIGSAIATASLDVDVFPLVFVEPLATLEVDESQFIILLCQAYGFPTPEITWLRNTTVITVADEKRTIVTEEVNDYYVRSVLNISQANPNLDQGEYKCRIDNHIVNNQLVIDSVNIHVEAINDCRDVNNPTISRCENNGTCLDEIDGYVCFCQKSFTGINCNELVEFIELPTIITGPEEKSVQFLQPVNISCNATGQPPPIFSWFKDDIFITNTSAPVLTITEALPDNRGEYTCIAQNAYGSSDRSAPGLLSITNVFQYKTEITECQALESQNFQDLVAEISDFIAGRKLNATDGTIYSVSPLPVRSGQPPQDQIVITVIANSSNRTGIADDLLRNAAIVELQSRFECQFTDLERFDGCPLNSFIFDNEYNETVSWPESEIGNAFDMMCPCGKLNISMYEERLLTRNCGGTFTYGAEWINVINNCDYSNYTFTLCSTTTLEVSDQFEILTDTTTAAQQFTALDFAIASTIMQTISEANTIVSNKEFQRNFTSIFNQLLQTGKDAIAESQGKYLASASLLETLSIFARRIELDENVAAFEEELLQFKIENTQISLFNGQSFIPDLSEQETIFQEDFERTPLMGATITLPESLFGQLELSESTTRIVNYALLSDTLFIIDESTEQAMQIKSEEVILGNIIIAASLSAPVVVQNLEEPVIINFTLTEALTKMNTTNVTCVSWELPSTDPYGKWSEDGCRLVAIDDDDDTITCECSHLTHFGILMDISPSPNENTAVEQSLQIISYIGIILSIVCLIIIIATYLTSRKLRTRVVGQMLVHMCFALTLLYVAFLVAMHGQYYGSFVWFCYATSSVLQYSILVYFMWTITEAIHLYLKLVKVFGSDINHFVLKASVINWGVPIAIVAICTGLGIHFNQWAVFIDNELFLSVHVQPGSNLKHSGSNSGWISVMIRYVSYSCRPVEWPFYIGVLVPFGFTYILDWSLFVVIMCSLAKQFREKNKLSDTNVGHEYKRLVVIALCLSIMFGFGWIFAFVVPIPSAIVSTIAQYLFSIFIGFQGVMIFVLHGVRSSDARNEWKRWFYRVFFCMEKPKDLLSSSVTKRPSPKQHQKLFLSNKERKNPLYDSQEKLASPNPTLTTYVSDVAAFDATDKLEGSEHEFQTFEITYSEPYSSEEEETADIDLHDLSKVVFSSNDGDQ